jgi:hypothetical protein
MSNISGSYQSPYSSPYITTTLSYSEYNRDATHVWYHLYISASLPSGSSFGYELGWNWTINGTYFSGSLGSGYHSGPYTWSVSKDVCVSCSGSGGTLSSSYNTTRPGAEGSSGKVSVSGTMTVSSWNTAPTWGSTTANVLQYKQGSGSWMNTPASRIVPENADQLSLDWGGASDAEGDVKYYTVKRYINGVYSATIASSIVPSYCTDTIGTGNQGDSYYYVISVTDGTLSASTTIKTPTVYKNTFTKATLASSDSIAYVSANTDIAFTFSGQDNTNGSTSFSYTLTADKVTVVHNSADQTSPIALTVRTSGTLANPYIDFSALKTALASTSYNGWVTFTLTTTNSYGSSGSTTKKIWVDLRRNPVDFTSPTTSGTYTIGASAYYIPDKKPIVVSWGASSDLLGGAITYVLEVSLGGGSYTTLYTGTARTFSVSSLVVSKATTCDFRVTAKTTYGTTLAHIATRITLHYYKVPSITFIPPDRSVSSVTVSGAIVLNTSITGLTIPTATYKGFSGISVAFTPTNLTFSIIDPAVLADITSYQFSVTVQDSAGVQIGNVSNSATIQIPKYTPMFSIREKGVGINALADDTHKLVVGGNTLFKGNLEFLKNQYWFISPLGQSGINMNNSDIIGLNCLVFNDYCDGDEGIYFAKDTTPIDSKVISEYDNVKVMNGKLLVNNVGVVTDTDTSESATGSKIAKRTSGGYIYATYFNSSRAAQDTAAESYIYDTGDGFMRKKTLANVKAELWDSSSIVHSYSLSGHSQLVGDYTANSTANKMIWTIGTGYNTWATHYGLAYENGIIDTATEHMISVRKGGVTNIKLGMNGNALFNGKVKAVGGFSGVGRVPAFTWTGTIALNSSVTITHGLGYNPMTQIDGTSGNIVYTVASISTTQTRVTIYSSGGNTFTGSIDFF